MSNNITPIHHMAKDEYQKQRQQIRAQVGDVNREATAIRDQALAKLFVSSGWTQQELAEAEGKKQPWIDKHMRFGRFLNFNPSGINYENTLTERRFRSYWERTQGTNERQRFVKVLQLMSDDAAPKEDNPTQRAPRGTIAKRIIERFGDGKWHAVEAIIEAIGAPARQVIGALQNMQHKGTLNAYCARRRAGNSHQYRIMTGSGHKIDYDHLVKELQPILKELESEGKKNQVHISPDAVLQLTIELKRLLAKLAK